MKMRTISLAAALAAALPIAARAVPTDVFPSGNQVSIQYGDEDTMVGLGPLNIAQEPISVSAIFKTGVTGADGMLQFGVFSDPLSPGAMGSVDINMIIDAAPEDFSASYDGNPLTFDEMNGDFVAAFETTFADMTDTKPFKLTFSGFERGDQFQVNMEPTNVVPLPNSILMLFGALSGLAFIGRRRTA